MSEFKSYAEEAQKHVRAFEGLDVKFFSSRPARFAKLASRSPREDSAVMKSTMRPGQIHHVEYYVDDLERSNEFWAWLFELLGWSHRSTWSEGTDWVHPDGTYVVFARTESAHRGQGNDRQAAGLNHLAFHYESKKVSRDDLARQLGERGARILYDEEGYLCFEDPNRFAVELYVATDG
jgi:catechol 2,3-dioxygenase-like lactoylglutathione lyase family enzyme